MKGNLGNLPLRGVAMICRSGILFKMEFPVTHRLAMHDTVAPQSSIISII